MSSDTITLPAYVINQVSTLSKGAPKENRFQGFHLGMRILPDFVEWTNGHLLTRIHMNQTETGIPSDDVWRDRIFTFNGRAKVGHTYTSQVLPDGLVIGSHPLIWQSDKGHVLAGQIVALDRYPDTHPIWANRMNSGYKRTTFKAQYLLNVAKHLMEKHGKNASMSLHLEGPLDVAFICADIETNKDTDSVMVMPVRSNHS